MSIHKGGQDKAVRPTVSTEDTFTKSPVNKTRVFAFFTKGAALVVLAHMFHAFIPGSEN
jgi:hypothetical protein